MTRNPIHNRTPHPARARISATMLACAALVLSGCASGVTHTDRVAFMSRHNLPSTDIDSREFGSSAVTHVTEDCIDIGDYGCFMDTPAYSPDGRRIAFAFAPFIDTGASRAPFQVWIARADGSDPVQVAMTNGDSLRPAWSADGTRIAFEDDGEIVMVDLCTASLPETNPTHVTDGGHPTWSPNDASGLVGATPQEWIAFQSTVSGNTDIYRITPAGTNRTRLTTDPADDTEPAWTKPGTERERIAFSSDRTGDGDIYTMHPDGTNVQRITSDSDPEHNPDWSALGLMLVYEMDGEIVRAAYNGGNPRTAFSGAHPSWRQMMDEEATCGARGSLP